MRPQKQAIVRSLVANINGVGMPQTLTPRTVMQTFMNIYVAIKAEILFAFWASQTKTRSRPCIIDQELKL